MELILWRHAEAEMGEPDEGRSLTAKGQKQARKMGEWLDHSLPHSCKIFVSPAHRTIQTAEALGRKFKLMDELGPESNVEKILAATQWPDSREPVLVVGHQPTLGQLAALLIDGEVKNWTIRKGNVWWIVRRKRDDIEDSYLRAVITPELLTK